MFEDIDVGANCVKTVRAGIDSIRYCVSATPFQGRISKSIFFQRLSPCRCRPTCCTSFHYWVLARNQKQILRARVKRLSAYVYLPNTSHAHIGKCDAKREVKKDM